MGFIIVIALVAAHAGICGYLCAKSQPIYKAKINEYTGVSNVYNMPGEYEIKQIFEKFEKMDIENAFKLCDTVRLLGINQYIYQDYLNNFKRVFSLPVGYVLCLINVVLVFCGFSLPLYAVFVWLSLCVISYLYFFRNEIYEETADMSYPPYVIYNSTSVSEDISKLEEILNSTGPVAKQRVEIMRSLLKECAEYRNIFLLLTATLATSLLIL